MNENFSANERALLRGRDVPFEQLESLSGWYPVVARNDNLWWRFFGEKRFSEPFFTIVSPASSRIKGSAYKRLSMRWMHSRTRRRQRLLFSIPRVAVRRCCRNCSLPCPAASSCRSRLSSIPI